MNKILWIKMNFSQQFMKKKEILLTKDFIKKSNFIELNILLNNKRTINKLITNKIILV
jgi:hypothetical protein